MDWGRSPFRQRVEQLCWNRIVLQIARWPFSPWHWKSLKRDVVYIQVHWHRALCVSHANRRIFKIGITFTFIKKDFRPYILGNVTTHWYKRPTDNLIHQCGKTGLFTLLIQRNSLRYTTILRITKLLLPLASFRLWLEVDLHYVWKDRHGNFSVTEQKEW